MALSNKEIALQVLDAVGGAENVLTNATCMTRLHLTFRDVSKIDIETIKGMDDVLGVVDGDVLQIVFGPGKVTKIGDEVAKLTHLNVTEDPIDLEVIAKENKANIKAKQTHPVQRFFKSFANIFLPLLPGIAGAGLINGITKALNVYTNNAYVNEWWYALLMTIGWALFLYLPIFVGMNAAKEYKGSAILGGIGGALSISNAAMPLLKKVGEGGAILLPLTNEQFNPAAGGILAAVFTGIAFAYLERFIRKFVPDILDMFVTPLLTLIIGGFASLLIIQPFGAFLTNGIFVSADFIFNTMGAFGGFILATVQLPLVSVGLHRAFTPIHTMLNNPDGPTAGVNYLLPILMVAGGGQVGSALALYVRTKNERLKKAILASTPAGILGIGEPLMYGVTLPLMKPFVMACIGSGFGGAVISLLGVGAISQGVSGVLAPLIMNPGHQLQYLIGLAVAYAGGFVFTYFFGYNEDRITEIFGE